MSGKILAPGRWPAQGLLFAGVGAEAVLCSACLLGFRCRWHGRVSAAPPSVRRYRAEFPGRILIPVCPEMLGGLPCPRPPIKRIRATGQAFFTHEDKALRSITTYQEVTGNLIHGAEETYDIAIEAQVIEALLLNYSPSCDRTGFTGRLLLRHGIRVVNLW